MLFFWTSHSLNNPEQSISLHRNMEMQHDYNNDKLMNCIFLLNIQFCHHKKKYILKYRLLK